MKQDLNRLNFELSLKQNRSQNPDNYLKKEGKTLLITVSQKMNERFIPFYNLHLAQL
jgi:hypothetical protein